MPPNLGLIGRDALSGFGSGAGLGAIFGDVPGALIGGGIGALAGGLEGAFNSGPSEDEIYNTLIQKYLNSPEYAQTQSALAGIKADATTGGPTTQEQTALNQALHVANDQAGSSYGAIQAGLRARTAGGGGGATQAALLAAEGQGRSGGMYGMAESAAAGEDARRKQARDSYARLALQAQQIGDQYRQWASGKAHGDSIINEDTAMGTLTQALSGVASVAGAAKKAGYFGGSGSKTNTADDFYNQSGATASTADDTYNQSGAPNLGLQSWLDAPSAAPQSKQPIGNVGEGEYPPAPTAAEQAQMFGRKPVLQSTWR